MIDLFWGVIIVSLAAYLSGVVFIVLGHYGLFNKKRSLRKLRDY